MEEEVPVEPKEDCCPSSSGSARQSRLLQKKSSFSMVENPTYLNIDFIPKDPFFGSTTESASEFFADRPTAGLPHISG
jgi:hypothetical protein